MFAFYAIVGILRKMGKLNLNLLVALEALLNERSVSGAGKKLGLSPSAMSRALMRLRAVTGDQLLVVAGRKMVPTPHAEKIAERVKTVIRDVQAVLQPSEPLEIKQLQKTFKLRANEAFVLSYAARLSALVAAEAEDVRLEFIPKLNKDIQPLREGVIDLDIGVISGDGAELKAQTLYRDVFVGVVNPDHPMLKHRRILTEQYVAFGHVVASRKGHANGPVDEALSDLGLRRDIKVMVPTFPSVLAVVLQSNLIGLVPRIFCHAWNNLKHKDNAVVPFELPFKTPEIVISQTWHPKMDADPGHKWLRGLIFKEFRELSRLPTSKHPAALR
jgi:DNA-binding transcriptional LysR family regulator